MEDTPEQAEIRAAGLQAAEQMGWRKLARSVGMSASGVRKALTATQIREVTWTKLRSWYVREWAVNRDAATPSGGVALESMLQQVAPVLRDEARAAIVAHLGRLYGEKGLPAPSWVLDSPGGLEVYEDAVSGRRAPFAVLELSRGERVAIPDQPFAGDARNVVEQIASGRGVWHGSIYYPAHRIHRAIYKGHGDADG